MGRGDTFINALIGAVVTIVTSFIPFSPVLGGAVSGYLQRQDSSAALRVGAIAGAISLIPFVLVVFLIGSFLPFIPAVGAPGAVAGFFGIALVIGLIFGAIYTIGLGALGGYIGWYLRKEDVV